ncbi:MAG: hypothetical protein EAZ55_00825, partial [Cytophagales bacterium]
GAWLFSSFSLLYASIAPAKAQIRPQNDTLNVMNTSELEKQKQISGKKIALKGQVVDEYGEPIPGVAVFFQGAMVGATTDIEGYFSFEIAEGNTIVVEAFGYITQEIRVGIKDSLHIVLEETPLTGDVCIITHVRESDGIENVYQEGGLPPKPTGYLDITPAFDWIGNLFKRNKK